MASLAELIEPIPGLELSSVDRAWIAGFLEGEGYFALCGRTQAVQVAQVNSEPVAKLKNLLGGSIKLKKQKAVQHKDFFLWAVYGEAARRVMWSVYDLMSETRQEQIREALSHGPQRSRTKFTEAQMQDILSHGSCREMAALYNVSPHVISKLRRSNGWSR